MNFNNQPDDSYSIMGYQPEDDDNMYRKCVGAMIVNKNNEVLLCQRIDSPEFLQMPQGGIEDGEEARTAILREIEEETGIQKEYLEIFASMPRYIKYDIPKNKIPAHWENQFIGQKILFFLIKFSGDNSNINLNNSKTPEFKRFVWTPIHEVTGKTIDFKKKIYSEVTQEFEIFLKLFSQQDAFLNSFAQ